jgi:hypothetical protein
MVGGRLGIRHGGLEGLGLRRGLSLRRRLGHGRLGRSFPCRLNRRRSLVRFADGGAERLLLLASQVGGVATPVALQLEVLSNRFVEESHRAS